jgi:DNA primase
MDIVKGMGLQVKVASMPAGKDPDEYLRDNGADNFLGVIRVAPNVLEYTIREAMNQFDSSNLEGKVAIIGAVIPSLAQTENAVVIEGYIVRLAQLLKINESAIRSEFNKYLRDHQMTNFISSKTSPIGKQQIGTRENGSLAVIEENIIYMLTEHADHYATVSEDIVPTDFKNELRRSVFEKLKALYDENNGSYTLTDIKERLTPAESEELARIMVLDSVPDDAAVLHDYAKRFRLAALREAYDLHSARADELNRKGDSAFIQELSQCKQVNEEMKKWL